MNHLIFGLMQISSPGYYLTWIFPSGKNCHAVVIPGFKCDSSAMVLQVSSHGRNKPYLGNKTNMTGGDYYNYFLTLQHNVAEAPI